MSAPRRRGFTLIEATLSIVVVALVVVSSLEAGGAVARAQSSQQQRQFAARLAESLTAEIASKQYSTPTDTTGLLGTLANTFDRLNLLGIEAYASMSETPPRASDGTALTTDNTWTRTTTVAFVLPSDPTSGSLLDTGLRRITVSVSKSGRTICTRSTLKCKDD